MKSILKIIFVGFLIGTTLIAILIAISRKGSEVSRKSRKPQKLRSRAKRPEGARRQRATPRRRYPKLTAITGAPVTRRYGTAIRMPLAALPPGKL